MFQYLIYYICPQFSIVEFKMTIYFKQKRALKMASTNQFDWHNGDHWSPVSLQKVHCLSAFGMMGNKFQFAKRLTLFDGAETVFATHAFVFPQFFRFCCRFFVHRVSVQYGARPWPVLFGMVFFFFLSCIVILGGHAKTGSGAFSLALLSAGNRIWMLTSPEAATVGQMAGTFFLLRETQSGEWIFGIPENRTHRIIADE